jgi:hypothetical protein
MMAYADIWIYPSVGIAKRSVHLEGSTVALRATGSLIPIDRKAGFRPALIPTIGVALGEVGFGANTCVQALSTRDRQCIMLAVDFKRSLITQLKKANPP